jgi:hypothetical protein
MIAHDRTRLIGRLSFLKEVYFGYAASGAVGDLPGRALGAAARDGATREEIRRSPTAIVGFGIDSIP